MERWEQAVQELRLLGINVISAAPAGSSQLKNVKANDYDVVLLVPDCRELTPLLSAEWANGFHNWGELKTDRDFGTLDADGCTVTLGDKGRLQSWYKGDLNLIFMDNSHMYTIYRAAGALVRELGLTRKDDRIALFTHLKHGTEWDWSHFEWWRQQ